MAVGATSEALSTSHLHHQQTRDTLEAAAMNSDCFGEQTSASHEVAERNIITLARRCRRRSLSNGCPTSSSPDSRSLEPLSCDKNTQQSDATIGTSQWPGLANEKAPKEGPQAVPTTSLLLNDEHAQGDAVKPQQDVTGNTDSQRVGVEVEPKLESSTDRMSSPTEVESGGSDERQFKLPIAKSPPPSSATTGSIEIDDAKVGTPANQRRRIPQRRASVFSLDGLSQLDQEALRKHPMLTKSSDGLANIADPRPDSEILFQETKKQSHQQQQQQQNQQQNQQGQQPQAQLQQQPQQQPQQVMIGSTNKSGDLATAKVGGLNSSSTRRSARSDTLGSTGSSRASSCDEPTIISSSLISVQKKPDNVSNKTKSSIKASSTESSTSSLDSIESDPPSATTSGQLQQIKTTAKGQKLANSLRDEPVSNAKHDPAPVISDASNSVAMDVDSAQTKRDLVSSDSSNASSDDVFHSELEVATIQSQKIIETNPPLFQSIKTQIKRNSVPDAKTISQHIDRLISQNEAIMENWNQVSIRSYNSQAMTSTTATASTSTGNFLTIPKDIKSSSFDEQKNFSGSQQAAKQLIKQRWSTAAMQTNQPQAQPLANRQENSSLPDHSHEDSKIISDSLNQSAAGTRLRKRSYHNQHTIKRLPARQNSDASQLNPMMFSSNIFSQATSKDSNITEQKIPGFMKIPIRATQTFNTTTHRSDPCATEGLNDPQALPASFGGAQNALGGIQFSLDTKHVLPDVQGAEFLRQTSLNQTIESAIKNLSLKRQGEHIIQQTTKELMLDSANNLQQQPGDIVIASLLAERQRQLQILDDYIRQQQLLQASSREGIIPATILNHYHLQQQQQQQQQHQQPLALEHQLSLNRIAALEQGYRQELNQRILATSIQQQQESARLLMQPIEQLNERQARESQVLNEFLAKMILDRAERNQEQTSHKSQQQALPIVRHSDSNEQKPSEMFTQPLDSATPSHRCDACDISFWTRDLLNYHLMTSCSARSGPEPTRPLAFKFNQPNGFDQLASPALHQQQVVNRNLLMPPDLSLSTNPGLSTGQYVHSMETIDFSKNGQQAQRSGAETFQPQRAHQAKSASPPRRRTYNEMQAPDLGLLEIPARYQTQLNSSSMQTSIKTAHDKQPLVAPKSPHKNQESAERAWQQRLDELSAFKKQLSTTMKPTSSSNEIQGSNLPIKKRKISEPNMRY